MDNTDFERYFREMRELSAKSRLPSVPEKTEKVDAVLEAQKQRLSAAAKTNAADDGLFGELLSEAFPEEKALPDGYTDIGSIYFFVSTASGAIPIPNVTVTVTAEQGGDTSIERIAITGRSGLTERIELPAPDRKLTEFPSENIAPYGVYNAKATRNGYYTVEFTGLQVFGGQTSYVPINLVPLPAGEESGEIVFDIPGNPLINS